MATTSIGTASDINELRGFHAFGRSEIRSKVSVREWELTGTYAAGGFAYDTAGTGDALGGFSDVYLLEFPSGGFSNGTLVYHPWWDRENSKVKLHTGTNTTGLIQAADGTNFASYKGVVKIYGV